MSIKNNIERILADKNSIKTAIEAKGVIVGDITLDGYADKIALISSSPSVEGKLRVRFIDYDGTILQETYVNSGESITAPTSPTHDLLTFQGWNYDSSYFTNITSDLDVGATYITSDGKTYFYITLNNVSGLSLSLYFNKSDTSTLTIDWGDGNNSTLSTSGNVNISHTYASIGDYVIKTWISSGNGTYLFGNGTSTSSVVGGSTNTQLQTLIKVYVGNKVNTINSYAFNSCSSLISIMIPTTLKTIGLYSLSYCYSLEYIIIPNGVTSILMDTFISSSISIISIPTSVTNLDSSVFYGCQYLKSIILPSSITKINGNTFQNCTRLSSITFLGNITNIGEWAFAGSSVVDFIFPNGITNIYTGVFYSCRLLKTVIIPSSVTKIYDNAFAYCYSFRNLKLQSSIPPTLTATNVFTAININCKIQVPAGSLSAYQTATNWSTYANYMEEY